MGGHEDFSIKFKNSLEKLFNSHEEALNTLKFVSSGIHSSSSDDAIGPYSNVINSFESIFEEVENISKRLPKELKLLILLRRILGKYVSSIEFKYVSIDWRALRQYKIFENRIRDHYNSLSKLPTKLECTEARQVLEATKKGSNLILEGESTYSDPKMDNNSIKPLEKEIQRRRKIRSEYRID